MKDAMKRLNRTSEILKYIMNNECDSFMKQALLNELESIRNEINPRKVMVLKLVKEN